MAAILRASDLTLEALLDLLGALRVPPAESGHLRIWADAVAGWTLDYWRGRHEQLTWYAADRLPSQLDAEEAIRRSQSGRLFAPSGELRWRVVEQLEDACWRTVFLGTEDWPGDRLRQRGELAALRRQKPDKCLLWGQRSDNTPDEWIELRIPHRIRYPIDVAGAAPSEKPGVQAVVETWVDGQGEPHFTRLCDLKLYPESEET